MTKPSLLIVSFSDIANDARVKKQIGLFAEKYHVTTCGRGPAIREDVEHLQLSATSLRAGAIGQAICLRLHAWRAAFFFEPEVKQARRLLKGRIFDVAIANDVESVVVAAEAAGYDRTLSDLHEYWPGLHDQSPNWVKLRQPFYNWMIRRYVARAGAAITVSQAIADRYLHEFGIACKVVHNATPKHDLAPTAVGANIRIVHSGGTQPNRRPEIMMRAVANSSAPVSLDMYLTGQGTEYARTLIKLANELGDRVRILPPKPYDELIAALNQYDVGIHILPPTNTNNVLALPNKLFDYVQARLAVVAGPTPDIQRRVDEFDLGVITEGFDEADVQRAVDALTPAAVAEWKHNAHRAAQVLNAEYELPVLGDAIDGLLKARQ